jgi:antitoxin HicB
MADFARVPLRLEPQPEGGFTVTSPLLPELITEGWTVAEAIEHAQDAFLAVLDMYRYHGWTLPDGLCMELNGEAVLVETVMALA